MDQNGKIVINNSRDAKEFQIGWGWKGPLKVTSSNVPAQAGPLTATYPVQMAFESPFPRREIQQPLWAFSLDLGSPELDAGLQVQLHPCLAEGKDHFPQPAVNKALFFFLFVKSSSLTSTYCNLYLAPSYLHWLQLLLNQKTYLTYWMYNQIFYCKSFCFGYTRPSASLEAYRTSIHT